MTDEEYLAWVNRHGAEWPEVHEYLTDTTYGAERRRQWREDIQPLSVEVADQVTREMLDGVHPRPRGAAAHRPAIIVYAARITSGSRRLDPIVLANCRYSTAFKRLLKAGLTKEEIWDVIDHADDPIAAALNHLRARRATEACQR